jgi:ribonuclease P/MRP protein subunit RPP1
MFFDLNVLLPTPTALILSSDQSHKKGKQKQKKAPPDGQSTPADSPAPPALVFSPAQVAAIEARIDLLVQRT